MNHEQLKALEDAARAAAQTTAQDIGIVLGCHPSAGRELTAHQIDYLMNVLMAFYHRGAVDAIDHLSARLGVSESGK